METLDQELVKALVTRIGRETHRFFMVEDYVGGTVRIKMRIELKPDADIPSIQKMSLGCSFEIVVGTSLEKFIKALRKHIEVGEEETKRSFLAISKAVV